MVGETISVIFVTLAAILYAVTLRRLWKRRGWIPRVLYLIGGLLLGVSLLRFNPAWSAIGIVALMLARMVPDRGKARPG